MLLSQPTIGGAALQVCQLVEGLDKERFEVAVVSPADGWLRDRILRSGAQHFPLALAREIRPWPDGRALLALWRLVRTWQPDVLHAHSSKAGFLGRWAARMGHVPVVLYTPHGFAFAQAKGWRRRWYLWLERLVGSFEDRLVCVSESEAEAALQFRVTDRDRIVVVRNGVDPPHGPAAEKGTLRALLGVGPSCRIVAMVSRLNRPKQPEDLIRASTILAGAYTAAEVQFVFVGGGPLEEGSRALSRALGQEDRIAFLGDRPDVPSILADVNIVVLSSTSEGMPYTILEAMAAGKPVVGSRIPGVTDLIRDGENGYTYTPGEAAELSRVLRHLLEDGALRRRLGMAGTQRVRLEFTTGRMVREVRSLYEALLDQKSRDERPRPPIRGVA